LLLASWSLSSVGLPSISCPSLIMSTPAALCDKCGDPGATDTRRVTGKDVEIAGVQTYLTGDSDKLVLFSTDVFGHIFPNSRALADDIASAGFTVAIPDMFNGGAWTPEDMQTKGFPGLFAEWFPKHPQNPDIIIKVAKELQKSGKYKSIQATGYCYGAPHVVHLIAQGVAKAGVVCHPSRLTIDLADKFNAPILFNCAEKDSMFTPELRSEWTNKLKEKGIPATFLDYPSTEHGFAVRADSSEVAQAQKEKCTQNTIKFLKEHA